MYLYTSARVIIETLEGAIIISNGDESKIETVVVIVVVVVAVVDIDAVAFSMLLLI